MDFRGIGTFEVRDVQMLYGIPRRLAEFVVKTLVYNYGLYYSVDEEVQSFCFFPTDDTPHRTREFPFSPGMDLFSDGENFTEVYKKDLPPSAFKNSQRVNNYKEVIQKEAS